MLAFKADKDILCTDNVGGETIVLLAVRATEVRVEGVAKEIELEWDVYNV